MLPSDRLTAHFRIDIPHQKALARLSIETVADLLFHLPVRYDENRKTHSVGNLRKGDEVVVCGRLSGLAARKAWRRKIPITEGYLEDNSGKIKVLWFHQPYLATMYQDGSYVTLTGKVSGNEGKTYLSNPDIEPLEALPIERDDSVFGAQVDTKEVLLPVYRETKGVTSRWFYHTVRKCFQKGVLDALADPLPEHIRDTYRLPSLSCALQFVHTPQKLRDAHAARKRFAFEEIFYIQIQKAKERREANAADAYTITTDPAHIAAFTTQLPFPLTNAQQRAIAAIAADFGGSCAMSRLLEGDVGSGKTAVAAATAYAVVTSRPPEGRSASLAFGALQVAYMAPTEILATQHFESFIEYFRHLPISIGLLTGSGCMKYPSKVAKGRPTAISKSQLLAWVKRGDIAVVIGTHALMYRQVQFKHLAYVIIDEQHRFGTRQRKALAYKHTGAAPAASVQSGRGGRAAGAAPAQAPVIPHLLSMTATPIPRTLALTLYGDLDITLLDELPAGRKPVATAVITSKKKEMDAVYERVRAEITRGRQAYVICPRIDEPEKEKATALRVASVAAEAARLGTELFPDLRIATLHGKMTLKEKEDVMKAFMAGSFDILVTTSVVEVGVNVANATVIIIEGAERFGLAQLHQLRGRVARSSYQAYCFLLTESKSQRTRERLQVLTTAQNGFELAEYDLQFRGAGELYGRKQSGLSDLGMNALHNLKLVEAARAEARAIVASDPHLHRHPHIARKVASQSDLLHLE